MAGYWQRRCEKDKVASVNRAEGRIRRRQMKLYREAEEEIQKEIEKLYQKFADKEDITLAEAKSLILAKDFKNIDWEGMIRESAEMAEKLKDANGLPEDVAAMIRKQHLELEAQMRAYAAKGQISYLELRQLEIQKRMIRLYDQQQTDIYDHLKSEYDDGYFRSVFRTQQQLGFGRDFVTPNWKAVDKAILNRYDMRNFSRTLYQHCSSFSEDLKKNLVTGLIRGENLDRMASRIHKRMGVALTRAKTLVRTETAYIYEAATMDAYEQSGVEWYEYLATLDNLTSEMCRELDGKHFRLKDAVPGKNYPPMHPNCRSTTVCWFPGEETRKARTTRAARDGNGRTYSVPADLTYKEWMDRALFREYRFIADENAFNESVSIAVSVNDIVDRLGPKVKKALDDVTIICSAEGKSGYYPSSKKLYLYKNATMQEIEHELGHPLENRLFDSGKIRDLKKELVKNLTADDIRIVTGISSNGEKEKIFIVKSPKLLDVYQGRIYAETKQDCFDTDGNIDVDKMEEFISVAFQQYLDHPQRMARQYPELYQLIKEGIA